MGKNIRQYLTSRFRDIWALSLLDTMTHDSQVLFLNSVDEEILLNF